MNASAHMPRAIHTHNCAKLSALRSTLKPSTEQCSLYAYRDNFSIRPT